MYFAVHLKFKCRRHFESIVLVEKLEFSATVTSTTTGTQISPGLLKFAMHTIPQDRLFIWPPLCPMCMTQMI